MDIYIYIDMYMYKSMCICIYMYMHLYLLQEPMGCLLLSKGPVKPEQLKDSLAESPPHHLQVALTCERPPQTPHCHKDNTCRPVNYQPGISLLH